MSNDSKSAIAVALSLGLGCAPASAQFIVTPESDPIALFDSISGSSISLVGTPLVIGGPTSTGTFTGGLAAGLDFDSGLILSTGNVVDALGPNDNGSFTTDLNLLGDPDLDLITGLPSQDAAGLTFSFTTSTGDLFFNFLFASEEYEEFIGSNFNDVFAFFLTPDIDPNTPGNQPGTTRNLAVIQGSNDPISVNTVNPNRNASFYIPNPLEDPVEDHQFNGRTTSIIASAEDLGPGEHVIKIVIGDTADGQLDSAVFLQAGTFGGDPGLVTNGLPVAATLRQSQLSMSQVGLRDVNSRLFRLRTRQPKPLGIAPSPSADKGNYSAKGGGKVVIPEPAKMKRWDTFGSVHSYHESVDGAATMIPGSLLSIITLPDYDIDIYGGTVGVEYRYNDSWSLGAAVIGNHADIDMGRLGNIDSDGYAIALYTSYYQQNAFRGLGDWYADFLYSYGTYENDITRTSIAGSATSNSDSDNHTIAINTGLNLRQQNWVHGPFVSISLTDGTLDGFTETGAGASTFPQTDHESLVSRLGYSIARVLPTAHGTVIPQLRVAWEHEFKNDSITVGGFPLSAPVEDRLVTGLGVSWECSDSSRLFFNYEGRFGSDIESHQVNLRYGFQF